MNPDDKKNLSLEEIREIMEREQNLQEAREEEERQRSMEEDLELETPVRKRVIENEETGEDNEYEA